MWTKSLTNLFSKLIYSFTTSLPWHINAIHPKTTKWFNNYDLNSSKIHTFEQENQLYKIISSTFLPFKASRNCPHSYCKCITLTVMFYATNVDWDELEISDNMHVNLILMWKNHLLNFCCKLLSSFTTSLAFQQSTINSIIVKKDLNRFAATQVLKE